MDLKTRKQLFFVLLGIMCVTLLPYLGMTDFHTKGEPRESVVAYSMLETGNWILPESAGGDMAYKPPFFHWMIALSSLPLGEITEYSSRFPSAVATIVMALVFFSFFAKRTDPNKSFLATILFMSSFEVHRAAMNTRVDGMMTAFIVIAIIQLYKWWEQGMRGIPLWAILSMSMGTMTKGPIGFLLPCGAMGLFLLIKQVPFYKAFYKMAFLAILACIIPATWYYLAYLQGGDEFLALVKEENIDRFMGKMSYRSHENPVHYNFVTMIAGYVPWTLMLLLSLFAVNFKNLKARSEGLWLRMIKWVETTNPARLYALVSALFIFVFYCIPKSKRSVYLLPVYPFAAIFIADLFLWVLRTKPNLWVIFGSIIAGLTSLVVVVFGAIKLHLIDLSVFGSSKGIDKGMQYVTEIAQSNVSFLGLVSLLVALVFIFYFVRFVRKGIKGVPLMALVIALVMSLQLLLDGLILPPVLNHKSVKAYAAQIQELVPEGKIYGFIPIEMLRFYIINFYIGDRIALFEDEEPTSGYVLVGEEAYQNVFEPRYGDQYHFEPIIRTSHDDTVVRDYIWLYKFEKK